MTESVQGISYQDMAEQFGTPLYVYDGDVLTEAITELRAALHPSLEVFFSLKSNPNISVFGLLQEGGARAEVSSLVELRTVLTAGARPENIVFLGPGKSERELVACISAGIYAIICESLEELATIDRLAGLRRARQRVLLRINPAYSVTGSRLTMGGKPRQFGIDETTVLAKDDLATRFDNVHIAGIQVYMGTRILDASVVAKNTAYVFELAERVVARTGIDLDAVDIGGGLGVAYFDGEQDLDLRLLAKELNPLLTRFADAHPDTRLIMESGRFLTARAGTYLLGVRYVKESMGERFAVTDGGTHHHMAAVGIGSFVKRNFPIALLSREGGEPEPWQVTGPLCTPNDTLCKNAMLPPLRVGDLLGVRRSGAYGPTASPVLFLSHGYPAEVLVHNGIPHLVHTRDQPEDLLRGQRLVDFAREETNREE
ncbi:MAG TPA: type III PLP-dependent enzyme [Pseudonocardiaceae bacterium]